MVRIQQKATLFAVCTLAVLAEYPVIPEPLQTSTEPSIHPWHTPFLSEEQIELNTV